MRGVLVMSMLGRAFWAMLGFVREPDFNKEEEE